MSLSSGTSQVPVKSHLRQQVIFKCFLPQGRWYVCEWKGVFTHQGAVSKVSKQVKSVFVPSPPPGSPACPVVISQGEPLSQTRPGLPAVEWLLTFPFPLLPIKPSRFGSVFYQQVRTQLVLRQQWVLMRTLHSLPSHHTIHYILIGPLGFNNLN